MKRLMMALSVVVVFSSLIFAITRTQFLNNQKTQYEAEVTELQAAKDALLADANRIEKITTGMPVLEALIAETQDAELRGDWIVMRDQYQAELDSWDQNLAGWDAQIAVAQDKVDEIDRLLAQ